VTQICWSVYCEDLLVAVSLSAAVNWNTTNVSMMSFIINTTIKTTSEFRNVSVTATEGVVDGLALHGKQT